MEYGRQTSSDINAMWFQKVMSVFVATNKQGWEQIFIQCALAIIVPRTYNVLFLLDVLCECGCQ